MHAGLSAGTSYKVVKSFFLEGKRKKGEMFLFSKTNEIRWSHPMPAAGGWWDCISSFDPHNITMLDQGRGRPVIVARGRVARGIPVWDKMPGVRVVRLGQYRARGVIV
jgi:hypothetical protein